MSHLSDQPSGTSPRPGDVLQTHSGAAPGGSAAEPGEVAVIDMGASSIRLLVAEIPPGEPVRILEEASRGVLLGKETFTHGKIGAATMDATLRALEGFRKIMEGYGVVRYRAVATSAIREAANCDSFLDRVRLRTGLQIEVIDGSEENRLTYLAVRAALREHEALRSGNTLLIEVGGGSADISLLRHGEPVQSGTYALGAIRMRQSLVSFHGGEADGIRLLRRHIHNVVEDIRRDVPLREVQHFVALGGDMRFMAARLASDGLAQVEEHFRVVPRAAFLDFYEQIEPLDVETLVDHYHLPLADAETVVPALMAYRELLSETAADHIIVPEASLRAGLLLEFAGVAEGRGLEELRAQVLASAAVLGEKYRHDALHARNVARLATQLFDDLGAEHGLPVRDRLLLEVAALLHDVGIFIGLRAHHKHSLYILTNAEIFGLSQEDMAVVANVARYHRRGLPAKSHAEFMSLERERRVDVLKLAAILRLANALDADHLQKVRSARLVRDSEPWVLEVEGAGDMTMERLSALARADLFAEVFGRRLIFQEAGAAS